MCNKCGVGLGVAMGVVALGFSGDWGEPSVVMGVKLGVKCRVDKNGQLHI